MGFRLDEDNFLHNTGNVVHNATSKTVTYFKTHWIDYIILFIICLLLGAFDIFILKKSDNFLNLEYWLHAGTRLGAYILAAILGIRIGYPRIKAACADLQNAIKWNKLLIKKRETDFGDFINNINIETKKEAWKASINKRLARLDKISPDFFPLYYDSVDEKGLRSDEFFKGIKWKWLKNKVKAKADKYCLTRSNLEALIDKDYIDKNIHTLNIKYYIVYKHDFDNVEGGSDSYRSFHTRSATTQAKAKAVATGLILTVVLIFLLGAITLDIDKALVEQRVTGIISAIVNSIIDIGLTLWKFVNGLNSCEKIVRQEDLKAVVDKNEILVLYCVDKKIEYPQQPDESTDTKEVSEDKNLVSN